MRKGQRRVDMRKPLIFVCASCGGTSLEEIQPSATVVSKLTFIDNEGDHRYEDCPTVIVNSDSPGIHYRCFECGVQVEDGGMAVSDCVWLAKYLKKRQRRWKEMMKR